MNLVAAITGHRPGIEYRFVQVISFRKCVRFTAALGGGWGTAETGGPGAGDSPETDATCPLPDALNEITMTDAPGYKLALGGPAIPDTDELTQRMHATDWVIARERGGRWKRISGLFRWHSVTRIRRDAHGHYRLVPKGNRIGKGHIAIGGCPPPA
jgi:hypothetical protein